MLHSTAHFEQCILSRGPSPTWDSSDGNMTRGTEMETNINGQIGSKKSPDWREQPDGWLGLNAQYTTTGMRGKIYRDLNMENC